MIDVMTVATSTASNGRGWLSPVEGAVERVGIVPLTIEQYQKMIEDGILAEDGGVELLRGVIVRKDRGGPGEEQAMGHSPLHSMVVALLTALAARLNSEQRHMRIQLPVACPPDGAPEPDASIVRGTPRDYPDRLPGPGDVSCVIEVAHSSLERDRGDKLPIYAEAGIGQYVVINLQNNTVEVYTEPDGGRGEYRTRRTLGKGETVELMLPGGGVFGVQVGEVLP